MPTTREVKKINVNDVLTDFRKFWQQPIEPYLKAALQGDPKSFAVLDRRMSGRVKQDVQFFKQWCKETEAQKNLNEHQITLLGLYYLCTNDITKSKNYFEQVADKNPMARIYLGGIAFSDMNNPNALKKVTAKYGPGPMVGKEILELPSLDALYCQGFYACVPPIMYIGGGPTLEDQRAAKLCYVNDPKTALGILAYSETDERSQKKDALEKAARLGAPEALSQLTIRYLGRGEFKCSDDVIDILYQECMEKESHPMLVSDRLGAKELKVNPDKAAYYFYMSCKFSKYHSLDTYPIAQLKKLFQDHSSDTVTVYGALATSVSPATNEANKMEKEFRQNVKAAANEIAKTKPDLFMQLTADNNDAELKAFLQPTIFADILKRRNSQSEGSPVVSQSSFYQPARSSVDEIKKELKDDILKLFRF